MNSERQEPIPNCALCDQLVGSNSISLTQARALSTILTFESGESTSISSRATIEAKFLHTVACRPCHACIIEAESVVKDWEHISNKMREIASRLEQIVQTPQHQHEKDNVAVRSRSIVKMPELRQTHTVYERTKAKRVREEKVNFDSDSDDQFVEPVNNSIRVSTTPTRNCKQQRVAPIAPITPTRSISKVQHGRQIRVPCLFYANQERRGRFLYSYNWTTKESTQLYKYEHPREFSAAVAVGNELYDLGGTESKLRPTFGDSSAGSQIVEIFKINDADRCRRRGPALTEPRKEFSACAIDPLLYVIGGCFGDLATNSCETLDVRFKGDKREWKAVQFLNKPRGSHSTAIIDRKIFAIGGIGEETLDSVEVFNISKPKVEWQFLKPLLSPRARHATAVLDDLIYVIGGEGIRELPIETGEVYDPKSDQWTTLPRMRYARRDCGISILNGRIIVIGGTESTAGMTEPVTESMEAYDPREGKWHLVPWEGLHPSGKFSNAVSMTI